jgi:uncharacterized protein (TIGR00251 family)
MAATATRVQVRVSPRAGRSEVVGRHGEAWKLRVSAPPVDGRANDATLELLAAVLGVRPAALTLVAGAASRDKVVEIRGLGRDEVDGRLARSTRGNGGR